MRRAFRMRLKPGGLAEYRRHHDEIWPELVGEIERAGIAQITIFEAAARRGRRVEAALGSPAILVNAAGIFGPLDRLRDADPRAWVETLMVDTIGPYLTCRAFVGGMVDQGWGRIVNVSSAASL